MNQPSPQQQQEYLNRVKQELQAQMMQNLMTKISEQCFKTCASAGGDSLSNSEKNCVVNCMGRYLDTFATVGQTLQTRQR